jgi:hypothetical protein
MQDSIRLFWETIRPCMCMTDLVYLKFDDRGEKIFTKTLKTKKGKTKFVHLKKIYM